MDEISRAAFLIAQAACLQAEVAGMQAANAERLANGYTPAYDEGDFQAAIERSGCHHNAALDTLRS